VDGAYESKGAGWINDLATDIIWLDLPFLTYFPSLLYRTFRRLLGLEPSCSPGCQESYRETFFSSDSIIWWCITNHRPVQKRYGPRMDVMGVHLEGGKMRRLGGRDEIQQWVSEVERLIKATLGNGSVM
jgi:hypothetical protein